jgi:hypothetical protein
VAAITALVPKDLRAVRHVGSTIELSASSHQNRSQQEARAPRAVPSVHAHERHAF